jgi:hypothetical protein
MWSRVKSRARILWSWTWPWAWIADSEALLFYKSNEKLYRECKVIVWTAMGERQRELCKLLGASHVICKEDGEKALLKAVIDVTGLSQPSTTSI